MNQSHIGMVEQKGDTQMGATEGLQSANEAKGGRTHDVIVIVDGAEKRVPAGKYVVSQFKALVGVAVDRELNVVKGGKLHPLDDGAEIHVHAHEIFASAPRAGGSA